MPANVETMAYAGAAPWHGLGTEVSDNLSPAEMLRAAALDWTVSKRPMFTTTAPVAHDASLEDVVASGLTRRVPSHNALVRDSDGKVFGVCGNGYVPVQNSEAFEFFKKFTNSGKMKMETAGALRGGRWVWGLAKTGDSFVLPGKDEVRSYMLLVSPHEWGKSFMIRFTGIRVVCTNTLVAALAENKAGFTMPHIREFDETAMEAAEVALGITTAQLEDYEKKARVLASASADLPEALTYIVEMFQPKALAGAVRQGARFMGPDGNLVNIDPASLSRQAYLVADALTNSPGADLKSSFGTWWGAFNAVTYAVDHKLGGKSRDNALNEAWFGSKAKLKLRALDLAVEYATAA